MENAISQSSSSSGGSERELGDAHEFYSHDGLKPVGAHSPQKVYLRMPSKSRLEELQLPAYRSSVKLGNHINLHRCQMLDPKDIHPALRGSLFDSNDSIPVTLLKETAHVVKKQQPQECSAKSKRHWLWFALISLVALAIILGASIGATLGHKAQ